MQQQKLLVLRLKLRRGYSGLPRRRLCMRARRHAPKVAAGTRADRDRESESDRDGDSIKSS